MLRSLKYYDFRDFWSTLPVPFLRSDVDVKPNPLDFEQTPEISNIYFLETITCYKFLEFFRNFETKLNSKSWDVEIKMEVSRLPLF